ncbi:four-carbon acid sugar kinase family protein [Clostridium sp. UBA6640]|uniref:four-carbon acid sugar kinase family protein n=1 Tax=Clostridium sp. UBA6640 TaxID=1946370 RepID=UPI0025C30A73|nr:four-carbon acid sugar kinase family protein [Clostridium sp. UBA6640]
MAKLLIIADDFTGALDTGIQFKKCGIPTQVFTNCELDIEEIKSNTEVLVVNTESRALSKEQAYESVKKISHWAIEQGIEIIFKKTDSVLRGNIGIELQAVVDANPLETLFFLPGHPEIERITKNGVCFVSGELLENSVFGNDPFNPVTKSYIPDIIKEQSDISAVSINNKESIDNHIVNQSKIVICDTLSVEDIDKRLDELIQQNKLKLIAGCAALAGRLAKKLSFNRNGIKSFKKTEGLYVACGSLNEITKKQVEYAEKRGFIRKHLTPEQKLQSDYYETLEGKKFLNEILELCKENKKIIVDTFNVNENTNDYLETYNVSPDEVRFVIPKAHGRIAEEIMSSGVDFTILMTGGDTLMGYMKSIGCTQIKPICEIEKGVVVSEIEGNGNKQQVISKSGGFGTEDVFCRIAEKILNIKGREVT